MLTETEKPLLVFSVITIGFEKINIIFFQCRMRHFTCRPTHIFYCCWWQNFLSKHCCATLSSFVQSTVMCNSITHTQSIVAFQLQWWIQECHSVILHTHCLLFCMSLRSIAESLQLQWHDDPESVVWVSLCDIWMNLCVRYSRIISFWTVAVVWIETVTWLVSLICRLVEVKSLFLNGILI
jgi:hypothetical protein